MGFLAKIIYHKILRWKVVGNSNFSMDTIKKCVIIAVPHTSWHDFYIGLFLRSVTSLKTNFLGKKELFFFPFSIILRWLGGVPVDRFTKGNKVDAIASLFKSNNEFRIALSPEGTRSKVEKWRTGFYHIAKKANVPIIMVTLDFKNKINTISDPFYISDDIEKDFLFMESFFKNVKGKVEEFSYD
ncbi:MAG: 1-acyl-sn-glycerol-3-phosphate acyltransferase [Flavobacteriaceae bacterium]|nr:1-acyl-sn-glycerol-3-phosphate acyltransferase [Flavobacteriaceae bacterium]